MKKDDLSDGLRLTEAQVRKAIELAAREPPESAGLSLAQLREIAGELDIDEAALTKAVRQILADETLTATPPGGGTGAPAPGTSRFLVGRAIALGSFAAALGVFTTYIESGALDGLLNRTTVPGSGAFIDMPVALLLIVVTIVAAGARRFPKERLLFLAEATATWLGYGLGWAIGHGSVTVDLTRLVISAITGSALVTWFLSRRGTNARGGCRPLDRPRYWISARRGRPRVMAPCAVSLIGAPCFVGSQVSRPARAQPNK